MPIHPPTKMLTVALAAGVWLATGRPGTGPALALVTGAVLLAWSIRRRARRREEPAAPAFACPPPIHRCTPERIDHRPVRRQARDVRCPSSRPSSPSRRTARR